MFSRKPETLESLAMRIGDTLWDMVTIYSGKDCPRCIDDELRYIIAKNQKTEITKIVLTCETCGWTEKLDGSNWNEGLIDELPASKDDLIKEGIQV
jgi:hypothetical protein